LFFLQLHDLIARISALTLFAISQATDAYVAVKVTSCENATGVILSSLCSNNLSDSPARAAVASSQSVDAEVKSSDLTLVTIPQATNAFAFVPGTVATLVEKATGLMLSSLFLGD